MLMRYIKFYKMFESKIECLCGWSWKESEGGKDKFICHKCGRDTKKTHLLSFKRNNDDLNEILSKIGSLNKKILIRTKEDSIILVQGRKSCEVSYYYSKVTLEWLSSKRKISEFENIDLLIEFIKKNFK